MKKVAVIDIGSNSVRLMLTGEERVQKFVSMTQLGKGLHDTGRLQNQSMQDSLVAIKEFIQKANGCKVHCFATEAVRSAENGKDFCKAVKEQTGIIVDILSPEEEAIAGYLGACGKTKNATVLDVGGASTEIITGENGKILSATSIPIGAVRLFDRCGEDIKLLNEVIKNTLPKDITVSDNLIGIGGTITAIGAMIASPSQYLREKVHGKVLTTCDIEREKAKLLALSVEDRVRAYPVLPLKRARVMVSGASIITGVMNEYKINNITVSDSDNAEGYLILRYEN